MKTSLFRIIAASFAWLALTASIHAADIYFSAPQFGSSYCDSVGVPALDNPNLYYSASGVTAPASSVVMQFHDPSYTSCLFVAYVDTSVATGNYYIGYFPGGGDCYVYIY